MGSTTGGPNPRDVGFEDAGIQPLGREHRSQGLLDYDMISVVWVGFLRVRILNRIIPADLRCVSSSGTPESVRSLGCSGS